METEGERPPSAFCQPALFPHKMEEKKGTVIAMKQSVILLNSVTHAVRGQQLLAAQGISSHIVRNAYHTATSGCGYGLAVGAPPQVARNILLRAGIQVVDVREVDR